MNDIIVRHATENDIKFIISLAKSESESLGFLPSIVYLDTINKQRMGKIWVCLVNNDLVGFVYTTPGKDGGSIVIVQICVRSDARRLEYATSLVNRVENNSIQNQRQAIKCTVATDIDAKLFWDHLGYKIQKIDQGGIRRKRLLERRYKLLPCGLFITGE